MEITEAMHEHIREIRELVTAFKECSDEVVIERALNHYAVEAGVHKLVNG